MEAAAKRVSDHLDECLHQRNEFPGIQYVVVTADKILLNYAGGVKDVATMDKVNDKTGFLSASTTKVLTAAAVMKLVQEKKVQLEDSLSKYYSQHPYGNDLTIRHLLNQSSGIPNPMPLKWLHTQAEHQSFPEDDVLQAALQANANLSFAPGEKYSYSNLSYWLLGKVIEKVSGMPYADYMRKEVFQPLKISPEELDCDITTYGNYARGHQARFSLMTLVFWMLTDGKIWDQSSGHWARFQYLYMNGPSYGGVSGTALGYAKFLQDMLQPNNPILLTDETRSQFLEEQTDASGATMPTTLGWHRGKVAVGDDNVYEYYEKPGGGPGYNSNIRIYPKAGIATVYLMNKTEVSETPIKAFSDKLDIEFLKEEKQST